MNPAGENESWGWSYGWPLALLPGMEQQTAFNAFNFSIGMFGNASGYTIQQGNTTVEYIQLSFLLCPSDGTRRRPGDPRGSTNYVGNYGGPGCVARFTGTIVPNAFASWPVDAKNLGPFGTEGVNDGTSNTAMFSERLLGIINSPNVAISSPDSKRAIYVATVGAVDKDTPANITAFILNCKNLAPGAAMQRSNGNGVYWMAAYPWHIAVNAYLHAGPPNTNSCHNPKDDGWLTFVGSSARPRRRATTLAA